MEAIFIPLSADRVHIVIVSDATDQNVRRVSAEMLSALETLAAEGPSAEELEDELLDARRYHADPSELPSQLFYTAAQHLLGAPAEPVRKLLAAQERLEPAEVARAIDEARRTLVAIVPEGVAELPGLAAYPVSSSVTVEGRRFRPPGLRLRRSDSEPTLVVGQTGVMFTLGDLRSTVAFDECAVALRYPDGSRTLLSESGFFVGVDPQAWKDGDEAVAAIDAAVPEELVVRMEPVLAERTDAIEQLATEKLNRRWVVAEELQLLPERLGHDEEVVTLCEAMKGLRAGLLVATNHRVIFFARIGGETWLEFPYDTITRVQGKESLIDSTVTLEARDEEITFRGIAPRERATDVAREIESRRNARRTTPGA